MKLFKLAGAIPALALVLSAGVASAAPIFDITDANVTPDVIFGSGNANGGFSISQNAGIEIGLRGKLRFDENNNPQNTFNSNGDGTYTFQAGNPPTGFGFDPNNPTTPVWNFEWSVNTDYDESTGKNLNDFDYFMSLDVDPGPGATFQGGSFDPINVLSGDRIPDHAIGGNSTVNGGGSVATNALTTASGSNPGNYGNLLANNNVAQNSWSYEFFNTSTGDPTFGFDPNEPGSYVISLAAVDKNDPSVNAFTSIEINVAPIPLPAAGWLLLSAFGGLGLVARRRRKVA